MTTPTSGLELHKAQTLIREIVSKMTNPDLPDSECLDQIYSILQSDGWITPT